ncbi:MAG: gamma-glutamyltransferase, partial [Syntrophales bacterium]|nr:gamma-glutamyltransferase [Syntrophales bacterium]
MEPYGSGLGGEGMIVLYRADTKTVVAIDYRSTAPAVTNYSKMIPKMGYAAAAGAAGAARIISTTAILTSNLLDHKMGIYEAIESPRYFARDAPNELQVEKRIPQDTLDALARLGYSLKQRGDYDPFFGGAQ